MKQRPLAGRLIDMDQRNRFPVGKLTIAPGLRNWIAKLAGAETADMLLSKIVYKHAKGYGGRISIEDRVLNEHVLNEHALRGTTHVVVSRYVAHGVCVELVTHLGERRTTIRPGVDPFGSHDPQQTREAADASP